MYATIITIERNDGVNYNEYREIKEGEETYENDAQMVRPRTRHGNA